MSAPRDAAARERALDPQTSFVVQAPAGSGKTELLTRRILTLLATVEEPEQVVAITFTKKAAAEMRERVVELLRAARAGVVPASDYEADGLALAAEVLRRDEALGWRLLEDPQRLSLSTVDSLATRLAHRLPLTSTLGAPSGIAEEARDLYLEAARRFIDERLRRLDRVLLRLGNRFERLQALLADLLGVRDQWMRFVMPYSGAGEVLRERLEDMLGSLVATHLDALERHCPDALHAELPAIARQAARWLEAQSRVEGKALDAKQRALVDALADMRSLPEGTPDAVPAWCAVARFLLTDTGTVRATVNKSTGFPPKAAAAALDVEPATLVAHKADMESLLGQLADEDDFVARLHAARTLPASRYTDEDWAVLEQLVGLLPELVAELHLLFGERGRLDFPEVAQRAVTALGSDEQPTDLALSMDMDLRHVLVDEFQDTSRAQWGLFSRLVAGWESGDGRTFFIVGDPMQSIYRFREGDVALFLKARDEGIGAVRFESLRLEVNFRSTPPLIDWINDTFGTLFPKEADADVGAVTYEPSVALGDGASGGAAGTRVHALAGGSHDDEAQLVATLVEEALAGDPATTVGILVRSRPAARPLIAALQARAVPFRAVEMEPLGERPVVRDLVALTLALRGPHDRLHWLAVLRGPLCGLVLADLHALVADGADGADGANGANGANGTDGADGAETTLLERLGDEARLARLSEDGRARVARFTEVVVPAAERAARSAIVPWVEAVWLRLGGPAACTAPGDLDAAERCLARLVELERDGRIWRRADVMRAVERLFAADPADERAARVQLMTVHKSKGLEFDTVIVPGLARQPARDDMRLIDWHESSLDGEPHLLFGAIDPPNTPAEHRDPVVRLIRARRARAESEEKLRLLYVACTRARRQLHLTTPLALDKDGRPRKPPATSFLAPLFEIVRTAGDAAGGVDAGVDLRSGADGPSVDVTPGVTDVTTPTGLPDAPPLLRTASAWQLPAFDRFAWREARPLARADADVEHDHAGGAARDVGTVVHRALLRLSCLAEKERRPPDAAALGRFALELRNLGVSETLLAEAAERVALAVANTLDDERGRWILDPGHAAARSEWPVTVPTLDADGRFAGVERVIFDRTFVDADGTRWVVDYKTGFHEGGGTDEFLDREAVRYREQLERYADIVARMDARAVRVGLWFPMVRGWRELAPAVAPQATLV